MTAQLLSVPVRVALVTKLLMLKVAMCVSVTLPSAVVLWMWLSTDRLFDRPKLTRLALELSMMGIGALSSRL